MYHRLGFNPLEMSCMSSITEQWRRVHSAWPEGGSATEPMGRKRRAMRWVLGHARSPRSGAPIPVAASSGMGAGGLASFGRPGLGPLYADGRGEPCSSDFWRAGGRHVKSKRGAVGT